ncbi:MAG: cytochrome c maturation protein CcmE [Myxococcales bacterium]|nr:cytochrome c maturation protein CcmE [Myxococcales bacterium]MCB9534518.1 cytochrome c maturation protein CcmE [Myxococcales bacterium]
MSETAFDDPFLAAPPPSNTRLRNVGFVLGAIAIAAALVGLTVTSLDAEVYYYTVDEATAQAAEIGTHEFRLKGHVVAGSRALRDGTLDQHRFVLQAGGQSLEVLYTGALPDTFADEAEVIALGRLTTDGSFEATEVVAKCPSRYEEAPPTSGGARASR